MKWLKYKLESCWRAYINVKNKYFGKLKYKKKISIQQKIQDCKNDTKKLHRLVTHLTGTEPRNPLPDDDANNDTDLANSFADFFQSKIKNICEMFIGIEAYNPEKSSTPKLCQFTPMTESEVKTIMMSMKSKSWKIDPIPTHIYKQLLPSVIPIVTKIVNLSLSKGEFCQIWKTAVVRPLLKKEGLDPIKPNYRPVSNLTFMSKVIEKCMLHQLKHHCDTYNLLPDYQSAYWENYSCETCLLQLTNDILWVCEHQSVMSLTALNLSAAFDTVDHSILISTLKTKFGINDLALKWFECYLQPRSFKVAVNGKYSDEKQLTYSVPQGSCSGAYLFNLYCSILNDIIPSDLHLSGFADDHTVRKEFRANDRNAELQTKEEIKECMVNIRQWMDWVRLKMNSVKTEFMYFGSKVQLGKCVVTHLNVNNEIVE